MKPSIPHHKGTNHIWTYTVFFLFSALVSFLAVKNIKISSDSMVYSLISQEILSGNGIRLPIIRLADNYSLANGTVPFLEQPPLLPLLYALLGGVRPDNFFPALMINAVSHAAISIFTFLLMKELYDNIGFALLTGVLVAVSSPLLWNANHMLSDSLFIALIVATFYFLVLYRHSDNYGATGHLIVASLCASASILTRFPGMTLIPLFFWEALLLIKSGKSKKNYAPVILVSSLPLITTVLLFIQNLIVSGTILGYSPPSPERSHLDAFAGTIKMMFLQFDLGKRAVALIAIFAFIVVLYIILSADARRAILKHLHSGLDLIIIFMIGYTVLIYTSYTRTQTVFEPRYMSPLVPFLFILFIITIVFISEITRSRGFSRLSLWAMVLSLVIISLGTCYKTYLNLGDLFYKQRSPYAILNSPTYKWIKENYGEDVIIATNHPFRLSFFGGYSTVRLPHKRFMSNIPIPDNMESFLPEQMSRFGAQVLALFDKVEKEHEGSYLAELFGKRTNDENFTLMQTLPDGVVYKLKE
jgi:hypothetical protein